MSNPSPQCPHCRTELGGWTPPSKDWSGLFLLAFFIAGVAAGYAFHGRFH